MRDKSMRMLAARCCFCLFEDRRGSLRIMGFANPMGRVAAHRGGQVPCPHALLDMLIAPSDAHSYCLGGLNGPAFRPG